MIAGLSKAVTLYLAPLLMLTTILLSLFAFLAPVVMLHDQVALLTVTPSTALTQGSGSTSSNVDGPSIFLGALGSCSRPNNAGPVNCTIPSISPIYDLAALPGNAPSLLLTAPTAGTPVFIAVALVSSIIFFTTFILISFRHKMRNPALFEKPIVQKLSAWLGFFGFFIGITSFLILRMWFAKAVEDFNGSIAAQGSGAPSLVANAGNAFTMVWVAYAFYAVPLISALAKLNVTATK